MRIGSLFSGIGGLELGLEWAGVGHTVWQVEFDPFCRDVLAKHWPEAKRFNDVREVGAHNLEPVDVICGGYPCQPFSAAGKQLGEADPRHLWPEFARIVGEMGPRYVVLENVAAHLALGFGRVLGDLSDLGYDAEWSVISACALGAPHPRERVFVVAYSRSLGLPGNRRDDHATEREGGGASIGSQNREQYEMGPQGCERVSSTRWASEPGVPIVAHGVPYQPYSIKAYGNAVVPQVAEIVGRRLLDIHRGLSV